MRSSSISTGIHRKGTGLSNFVFELIGNINSFGKAPNGLKTELISYLFPQTTDVSSNLLALGLSQIILSIQSIKLLSVFRDRASSFLTILVLLVKHLVIIRW